MRCLIKRSLFICLFIMIFFYLEWKRDEEDQSDNNVWEDNWDDDNVEDDFSMQLR